MFITNLVDADRPKNNVMGGCFVDGHIVLTDEPACKKYKEWSCGNGQGNDGSVK